MNRTRHGKWNSMRKKCHVLEMGKSAMRPSWTYMLGEHILSIAKEEKDLRVIIQDTPTHSSTHRLHKLDRLDVLEMFDKN